MKLRLHFLALYLFVLAVPFACNYRGTSEQQSGADTALIHMNERLEKQEEQDEVARQIYMEAEHKAMHQRRHDKWARETPEDHQGEVKILETKTYHDGELWDDIEEKEWYGLFKEGKKYVLKKTKVMVSTAYDARTQDSTDLTVAAAEGDAVFLMTGLKSLTEGEVTSVPVRYSYSDESYKYPFKINGAAFYINCDVKRDANGAYYGGVTYTLMGSKKRMAIKQVITSFDNPVTVPTSVKWIGDIDRDGFPDYIMDLSGRENVSVISLFLSSKAESNQLVKMVARQRSFGYH